MLLEVRNKGGKEAQLFSTHWCQARRRGIVDTGKPAVLRPSHVRTDGESEPANESYMSDSGWIGIFQLTPAPPLHGDR